MTIEELLAAARGRLCRLRPAEAMAAMRGGAALIDIRGDSQIARDGTIPGALVIPRNVLEWRLDPDSQHRHPRAPRLEDRVMVLCDEGYQSSLAAATLQELGFVRATDVVGGFHAWREAGLPVADPVSLTQGPEPPGAIATAATDTRTLPARPGSPAAALPRWPGAAQPDRGRRPDPKLGATRPPRS
jgi:rhodanese-related sulfurtransferase